MNEYKKIAKDLKEFCSKKKGRRRKKKRENFVFCLKNRGEREREKKNGGGSHLLHSIEIDEERKKKRICEII